MAGFPHLPWFGKLSYYPDLRWATRVETKNWPTWEEWISAMALGMEHYRQPLLLTSILPQTWQTTLHEKTCVIICTAPKTTHECFLVAQGNSWMRKWKTENDIDRMPGIA